MLGWVPNNYVPPLTALQGRIRFALLEQRWRDSACLKESCQSAPGSGKVLSGYADAFTRTAGVGCTLRKLCLITWRLGLQHTFSGADMAWAELYGVTASSGDCDDRRYGAGGCLRLTSQLYVERLSSSTRLQETTSTANQAMATPRIVATTRTRLATSFPPSRWARACLRPRSRVDRITPAPCSPMASSSAGVSAKSLLPPSDGLRSTPGVLVLSQSIWSHLFGETRLFIYSNVDGVRRARAPRARQVGFDA